MAAEPQIDQGAALLALYDVAVGDVYRYLLARCSSTSVAEDLCAETFLAACDAAERGAIPAPTVAWLIGVARHKLADHWRREAREQRRLRAVVAEPTRQVDDPWEGLVEADVARTVLAALSPSHQAALVFRYVDGRSVAEVADDLGRTVEATESLLVRARSGFRDRYLELTHERWEPDHG